MLGLVLRITARVVLLFFLATARAVHTICEQPASSLMWVFPYMRFYQNVVSRFVDYTCTKLPGAQAYICYDNCAE